MKAIQMTTAAVAAVIAVVSFGGVLTVSPDGMSPREALLAIRATKVSGCARAELRKTFDIVRKRLLMTMDRILKGEK